MRSTQAGPDPAVRRGHGIAGAILALALPTCLPAAGVCADGTPWRIRDGTVRISVPLKPGGSFDARTGALAGVLRPSGSRPVRLAGEIRLDLTTIDTGIELRNRHLREKYLEVTKGKGFDTAVLSAIAVTEASDDGFRGRSVFTGTLLLHGVTRAVTGSCEIRSTPPGVTIEASVPLALDEFGIEAPQYMGVGVGNTLLVRVELRAAPGAGE